MLTPEQREKFEEATRAGLKQLVEIRIREIPKTRPTIIQALKSGRQSEIVRVNLAPETCLLMSVSTNPELMKEALGIASGRYELFLKDLIEDSDFQVFWQTAVLDLANELDKTGN